MPDAYVGVGSNVDREQSIAFALRELSEQFELLSVSSVYESAAVGFVGEPFFNLVVVVRTSMTIFDVAARLAAIEAAAGRIRPVEKFSARTLDLDLLLYGSTVLESGELRVPRDDVTRYAFVLEPLSEVAPHVNHPVLGQSFAALWDAFDKGEVQQHRRGAAPSAS